MDSRGETWGMLESLRDFLALLGSTAALQATYVFTCGSACRRHYTEQTDYDSGP